MTREELQAMVQEVAEETARQYIADQKHGDYYALPINSKGANACLQIAIYSRSAMLHSVETKRIYNACGIVENVFKLLRVQTDRIRSAFGAPVAVYNTQFADYNALSKDNASGLRATTFEKVVCDTLNKCQFEKGAFEWVGLKSGSTIDCINSAGVTIECKGLKGRIVKDRKSVV